MTFAILLPGIRIERYHLTARVAFQHRYGGLGPETQGPAHQRILIETSPGYEIEVDIRAEAALIQAVSNSSPSCRAV